MQIGKRSPQRNTSFQRLFSLPEEEFLINDFACAVKKKIPLQVQFDTSLQPHFFANIFETDILHNFAGSYIFVTSDVRILF